MSIRHFHKTRIAPTPSGFLHAGNILSFLLTDLLARRHGASLLLRIDDMDRARVRPEYVQDIFDTLRGAGIDWQEGPKDRAGFEATWSQRQRLPLYESMLGKLAERGLVYACNCSRSDVLQANPLGNYTGVCRDKNLPLDRPGLAWRMRTDHDTALTVFLRSGETIAQTLPATQYDFLVRKRDGFPAYQLTSLADDVHFGIDLIVRGEDLWDSTLAQLYLAHSLGLQDFEKCAFVHHHLLRTGSGEKLSKSAGAQSEKQTPSALAQLLPRLREEAAKLAASV